MPNEYCFGPLCFVPLTEPSPGIFGLQQFVPGLALMALAWTTADARYRFRVASAALPVRTITFVVLAIVGPLTLLTSLWHAQHWLVPRGNLLTPAAWQAILGGAFIGTFFLWAWVAFVRPPVFGPRNAHRYARAFQVSALRSPLRQRNLGVLIRSRCQRSPETAQVWTFVDIPPDSYAILRHLVVFSRQQCQ